MATSEIKRDALERVTFGANTNFNNLPVGTIAQIAGTGCTNTPYGSSASTFYGVVETINGGESYRIQKAYVYASSGLYMVAYRMYAGSTWGEWYAQPTGIRRKIKTYSSITIPSGKYVKIDSYTDLGFASSTHIIGMNIRGWSGVPTLPVTLMKSSTGMDIYLAGAAQSITSFSVEYYYVEVPIQTDS